MRSCAVSGAPTFLLGIENYDTELISSQAAVTFALREFDLNFTRALINHNHHCRTWWIGAGQGSDEKLHAVVNCRVNRRVRRPKFTGCKTQFVSRLDSSTQNTNEGGGVTVGRKVIRRRAERKNRSSGYLCLIVKNSRPRNRSKAESVNHQEDCELSCDPQFSSSPGIVQSVLFLSRVNQSGVSVLKFVEMCR